MRNALLAIIVAFAVIALSASAFAYPSYYNRPWFIPSSSVYYTAYTGYAAYNPYYNYTYAYPPQAMHSSIYPGGYYINTPYGTVATPDSYYYPRNSYSPAYSPTTVYYAGYPYGCNTYASGCNDYYGLSLNYRGKCFGASCSISLKCSGTDC